jgi:hypothetical protein
MVSPERAGWSDDDWQKLMNDKRQALNAETGAAILAAIGDGAPDWVSTETTFTIDPPVKIHPDLGDENGVDLTSVTIVVTRYNGTTDDDAHGGIRLSGRGYHLKANGTRDERRGLSSIYLTEGIPIVAPLLLQAMMRTPNGGTA